MMEEFFIRALTAGLCVALAAGPSGSFVLWLRMASFGSTLSYAAVFGACIAMTIEVMPFLGVLATGLAVVLAVLGFDRLPSQIKPVISHVIGYGLLACGVIAAAMLFQTRFDLMGFLFGDIFAMSWADVLLTVATALGIVAVLAAIWQPMLRIAVSPELAATEGLDVRRYRLIFTAALAGLVAIGIQIAGALLIMALLIIPAATARNLAATPERMALYAALLGAGSVLGGLSASLWQDVPAGPAIAACAALLFVVAIFKRSLAQISSSHGLAKAQS